MRSSRCIARVTVRCRACIWKVRSNDIEGTQTGESEAGGAETLLRCEATACDQLSARHAHRQEITNGRSHYPRHPPQGHAAGLAVSRGLGTAERPAVTEVQETGGGPVTKANLNQQATEKDTMAWMDDLMTRMLLRASMEHEVINQDGTVEQGGQCAAKAASAR